MTLKDKVKENQKKNYKSKRITRERIDPINNQYGQLCVELQDMG